MSRFFILFALSSLLLATGCPEIVNAVGDQGLSQTVEREEAGEAVFDFGEINADCSDEDPDDGVQYIHREDDTSQYCLIVIDWDQLMIDMVAVREEVESSVDEEVPGAGENVNVEFTEFKVNDLSIELVKETENGDVVTLPFDAVVYYLASLQLDEVNDLVQIDWPVPGEDLLPSTPRVTFSADGSETAKQELLDVLNEAYTNGDEVKTVGHAELEFAYQTEEEILALSGSRIEVNFVLALTGEGTYDIGQGFSGNGE